VFFVFSCGLTTVVAFAGIFALQTLGFTPGELLALFLALQLSSAGGAFAFGWIEDRLGAVRTIQITLVLWVLVSVGVYLCHSKGLFWGLALGAGLGIGSLQSASRGLVGMFSPPEKSGEFFGFWGLAGKAAYMTGPFLFGLIASLTGSQRVAMLSTAVFFLAGLVGMSRIDEHRGRAAVEGWHEETRADATTG
jgi:UMF1 family MFS transporter